MSEQKTSYKSKIGGQALIEGVMMNGVHKGAMACRLPNGTIDLEVWDKSLLRHGTEKLHLLEVSSILSYQ